MTANFPLFTSEQPILPPFAHGADRPSGTACSAVLHLTHQAAGPHVGPVPLEVVEDHLPAWRSFSQTRRAAIGERRCRGGTTAEGHCRRSPARSSADIGPAPGPARCGCLPAHGET